MPQETRPNRTTRPAGPDRWRRRLPAWPLLAALSAVCLVAAIVTTTLVLRGSEAEAQTATPKAAATVQPRQGETRAQPDQARAPRLSQISVTQDGDETIVRLRVDQQVGYRFFGLTEPTRRLVIDLQRVSFGLGGAEGGRKDGEGAVQAVRWAQKSDAESRVVLDLDTPVRVVSHAWQGALGGRTLEFRLATASLAEFQRTAPVTVQAATPATGPLPINPAARRQFTIVIDPGHGGRDPGAPGASGESFEKQMTLPSGLLLRDLLRRNPRYRVVMTRETDVFIPLEQRIVIARDSRADLFISLHADSAPRPDIEGATVYTLSEEGGERSRRLLNNENWTIAPANRTDDPRVTGILRDLTQRDTKNQSAEFAGILLRQLGPVGPLTGSSHRRAGFFVLLSPTVPAVLLEMGFMTDPDDERRLRDPQFRRRQMEATARAIDFYFDQQVSAPRAPAPSR